MARLKKRPPELSASTILEVIVASVLFLILFFLSMEMLVRLSGRESDDVLLQAEIDRQACVREFATGNVGNGEYDRAYEWGGITVVVAPYRELTSLQEVYFTTRITTGNRIFHFRILKKVDEEKTDE